MGSFWNTVTCGLLLNGSDGEGGECVKNGMPLLLVDIVNNVAHEPCSCRAPGVSIKSLGGSGGNEIPGGVHLVGTFDLGENVRMVVLGRVVLNVLQQLREREYLMVCFRLLGLHPGWTP